MFIRMLRQAGVITSLLIAVLIAAVAVAVFMEEYRLQALIAGGVALLLIVGIKVNNWRANQRTRSETRLLVTPHRGLGRMIYDRSDQTRVHIGGAQTRELANRETILTEKPRDHGKIVANDGPKGGAVKTSTIVQLANAHAKAGGTVLVSEATLAGSLPFNMGMPQIDGVPQIQWSARTLIESMTESALLPTRYNPANREQLLPSMTTGQFLKHTHRTDTGAEILFAAYEEEKWDDQGRPLPPWYSPERLWSMNAEGICHFGRVMHDTGNERTPLKLAALSIADAFIITTTTDEVKAGLSEGIIQQRIRAYDKPLLIIVVNEENAPMSRVLEIMRRFSKYGPVYFMEYVRVVKQTGRTYFTPLPLSAQEQAIECDAALTDLLNGRTPPMFPLDGMFKPLRTSHRTPKKKAIVETTTKPKTAELKTPFWRRRAKEIVDAKAEPQTPIDYEAWTPKTVETMDTPAAPADAHPANNMPADIPGSSVPSGNSDSQSASAAQQAPSAPRTPAPDIAPVPERASGHGRRTTRPVNGHVAPPPPPVSTAKSPTSAAAAPSGDTARPAGPPAETPAPQPAVPAGPSASSQSTPASSEVPAGTAQGAFDPGNQAPDQSNKGKEPERVPARPPRYDDPFDMSS